MAAVTSFYCSFEPFGAAICIIGTMLRSCIVVVRCPIKFCCNSYATAINVHFDLSVSLMREFQEPRKQFTRAADRQTSQRCRFLSQTLSLACQESGHPAVFCLYLTNPHNKKCIRTLVLNNSKRNSKKPIDSINFI